MNNLNIVDTTGAGDAFIGGYLMAMLACDTKFNGKADEGNEGLVVLILLFSRA